MSATKTKVFHAIGLPFVAAVITFVILEVDTVIVDNLPRSFPRESVILPWSVCVFGVLSTTLILPWLISRRFLQQMSMRVYFLVWLSLFLAIWLLVAGSADLLSKVYRLGL